MLIREHHGERHTVTVLPDGFAWQGQTFSSPSVIAKTITGTIWNGPRFLRGLHQEPGARRLAVDPQPL
ncbi:MAG: DUF2924 domain-containing protein [Xanthobacteraceae bacterium]